MTVGERGDGLYSASLPVQSHWRLSAHHDAVAFVQLDLHSASDVSLREVDAVHHELHLGCVPEPVVAEA